MSELQVKIHIKKKDLIAHMNENIALNKKIVEEAKEGYLQRVKYFRDDRLNLDKITFAHIGMQIPSVHFYDEGCYERAFRAFKLTDGPVIEMSEDQYTKFVLDIWPWSENFLKGNCEYSEAAKTEFKRKFPHKIIEELEQEAYDI